jgi:hypothetical protein
MLKTNTNRYMPCKALQIGNELLPLWELVYHPADTPDNDTCLDGFSHTKYHKPNYTPNIVDCVYDLQDKCVVPVIIKDHYPTPDKYAVGQEVMLEVQNESHTLTRETITEITYEEYRSTFTSVRDMDTWYLNLFSDEEKATMQPLDLYEIRTWKPIYKMKSGEVVKYDYRMYSIKEKQH